MRPIAPFASYAAILPDTLKVLMVALFAKAGIDVADEAAIFSAIYWTGKVVHGSDVRIELAHPSEE